MLCSSCQSPFKITEADKAFYAKLDVEPPTLCPQCRRQRRLAYRNEWNLYNRNCDLCKKNVISVFPKNSPYTTYCYDCWWSDKWDAMDYGRDFDISKSFFEQFAELEKSIPHLAIFREGSSENCEYVNYGMNNKSCYLIIGAHCEHVYYTHFGFQSKSCIDCQKVVSCEHCYECIDCTGCYELFFSQDCIQCSNSLFLKDCVSVSDSFCSVGLKNAKYMLFNKQLTKDEYKKRMAKIHLTAESINKLRERLHTISRDIPKKHIHGSKNENVSGDFIDNCKNLKECFDCIDLEDSSYCDICGIQSSQLMDCSYVGKNTKLSYEINGATDFNNCIGIYYGRQLQDSYYCQYTFNSSNLLGCIGLNHKKFCIFNKQYSEEEYKSLVPKIIEHMKENGDFGEFFPIQISPFPYNTTVAQEFFPLTKETATEKGYKWHDDIRNDKPQSITIPKHIHDINDSITNETLACTQCKRNYRIIKQELDFYRQYGIPIPQNCSKCRHNNRFNMRNPKKLHKRACDKCEKKIQTSYDQGGAERVYCEECYLKEVY